MRLFQMVRNEDFSGVSGTGIVARGVEFDDGTAVMRWSTATASTALYESLEAIQAIHGHEGRTLVEIVYSEDTGPWAASTPA